MVKASNGASFEDMVGGTFPYSLDNYFDSIETIKSEIFDEERKEWHETSEDDSHTTSSDVTTLKRQDYIIAKTANDEVILQVRYVLVEVD